MQHKHYLKGITSIRFFLAIVVVFMHCAQNLKGYDIFWGNDAPILKKGGLAVEYFFVLSGFLLTYLAYAEYQKKGKINIKAFFIRRVLRIFPLYYFAVFLGYLLLGFVYPMLKGQPYLEFTIAEGLPFHLFFLPNWIISKYLDSVGSLYSLWSIGVEEQFYLFFPFLCSLLFKKKRLVWLFGLVTISYFIFYYTFQEYYPSSFPVTVKYFVHTLKFHFMFLGGFFALLFHKYRPHFEQLFDSAFQRTAVAILFLLTLTAAIPILRYQLIYGSVFCLFLICLSLHPKVGINFENNRLKYLGSISYGVYIYHPIVSYPLRYFLELVPSFFELVQTIPPVYYLAEIVLTVLTAHLSYQYFELYFLRMKKRFK